jgi:class 3 adenylate cyclase
MQSLATAFDPGLAKATEPAHRCFAFCDVVGFTRLTERLGDRAVLGLMRSHWALVRRLAESCSGREIELRGDGVFLAFRSARDGLRCVLALQQTLHEQRTLTTAPSLHVRAGLHAGPAIPEGRGYFGRSVILAARVAARARPDEVLVSEEVARLVAPSGEFQIDRGRSVVLKGLGRRSVFRIDPGLSLHGLAAAAS